MSMQRWMIGIVACLAAGAPVFAQGTAPPGPQAAAGQGAPGPAPRSATSDDTGPDAAANRALVIRFFNLVFTDHRVAEAFALYVGKDFVEHHKFVGDREVATRQMAIDTLTAEFRRDPAHKLHARRVIAQGDLVSVHSADAGGDIDIFRVHNGKIVEHWDG